MEEPPLIKSKTTKNKKSPDDKDSPIARKRRKKEKPGRKLKFPDQNREERKRRVNRNEPYYNVNGVLVNPKVFKAVTKCCNRNCFENLSEELQEQEFNRFYTLGSYEARCLFIKSCVYLKQVTGKRKPKKKTSSFVQVFVVKKIPVCHKFFLGLFQIDKSRVRTVMEKVEACNISDLRGTHGNKGKKEQEPKTSTEELEPEVSVTEKPDSTTIKVESAEKESVSTVVKPLINTPFEKFK